MPVLSTISKGTRSCRSHGKELRRRWQAGVLTGFAVLCLLLAVVVPVTTYAAASAKSSYGWSEPQSGWLYVLDPRVASGKSVVWLVDPAEGVKGRLEAGYAPFVALSPEGTRLYVTSGQPDPTGSVVYSDELWAIDTASGVLLQRAKLSNRLTYTLPAPGGLAVSTDGRYVYVAKSRTIRPGVHEQTLQAFDTIEKTFLPEEVLLPDCGYPEIVPSSGGWQLVVKCSSSRALLINLAADGSVKQSRSVEVPIGLSAVTRGRRVLPRPLAGISPSPDARKLGLIMDNGEIYEAEIGVSPFRINPTRAPRLSRSHRVLHTRVSPRSSDGARAFVACASKELVWTTLTADEIHIFDTTDSWIREAVFRTTVPFSDLVLSADGRDLFAISPETRTLLTIDPATGNLVTSVDGIGVKPRFLVIAP